ncbi:hypothetical protein NXS19_001927 [Fusarium pseudograminearum]|nr:hypothetical protein NXS19_001927 [Fusarium pseudograminearum]
MYPVNCQEPSYQALTDTVSRHSSQYSLRSRPCRNLYDLSKEITKPSEKKKIWFAFAESFKRPPLMLMLRSILTPSRPSSQLMLRTTLRRTIIPLHSSRQFSSSVRIMSNQTQKLQPAARVQGQKKDVWSMINEAAASSPIQPIVNLGQGFFGYNPPTLF